MQHHDLHIYRGDSTRFQVRIDTEKGQPLDLTWAEVSMCVQPAFGEPMKPDITVSKGLVVLDFPPEATRNLEWRKAPYDLQIRKGSIVKTVLRGYVVLEQDITP